MSSRGKYLVTHLDEMRCGFYRKFNMSSCCYVAWVGYRHPFVICYYTGMDNIIKMRKTWYSCAQSNKNIA